MGIQKCKDCGTRFEYNELMKPLGGYPHPLICSKCGASHKITPISRWGISALIMLPVFIMISLRPDMNVLLRLLVYFVYLVISKALSPFILRYELEDKNENKE